MCDRLVSHRCVSLRGVLGRLWRRREGPGGREGTAPLRRDTASITAPEKASSTSHTTSSSGSCLCPPSILPRRDPITFLIVSTADGTAIVLTAGGTRTAALETRPDAQPRRQDPALGEARAGCSRLLFNIDTQAFSFGKDVRWP